MSRIGTAHLSIHLDLSLARTLMVCSGKQAAVIELLRRRRNVQRWILVEKVDRLHGDFDRLARHDWEVFHTWDLRSR